MSEYQIQVLGRVFPNVMSLSFANSAVNNISDQKIKTWSQCFQKLKQLELTNCGVETMQSEKIELIFIHEFSRVKEFLGVHFDQLPIALQKNYNKIHMNI